MTEQLTLSLSHPLTCDSVSGHQYLHEDNEIPWIYLNTSCYYWPAGLFIFLVKWKSLSHVQLFVTPWTIKSRTLEWVAVPFSRVSSQPRDWTQVSHIAGRFFTIWATREAFTPLRSLIFMVPHCPLNLASVVWCKSIMYDTSGGLNSPLPY